MGLVHLLTKGRARQLADEIGKMIPPGSKILDVGCGDGDVSGQLLANSYDVVGVDIVRTKKCSIPMEIYNGRELPFDDRSFDYAIFVDVLHHITDQRGILSEAARVARRGIVVKEVKFDSRSRVTRFLARSTLTLWDHVANFGDGYRQNLHYRSQEEWKCLFRELHLHIGRVIDDKKYFSIDMASLNFIIELEIVQNTNG